MTTAAEQLGPPQANYIYKPLSSSRNTRLVKFQPAVSRKQRLSFELIEVSIQKPPSYTAISYTWEGQQPDVPVSCEGKHLLITKNAYLALARLRPRVNGGWHRRYLWLDAICIDQSATKEKNSQVDQMSDIYKNASSVAAWLGPFDHRSPYALEWKLVAHPTLRKYRFQDGVLAKNVAFSVLTDNAYWTRLWTIQEMAVNDDCKVYVGDWPSIPAKNLQYLPPSEKGKVSSHLSDSTRSISDLNRALLRHHAGDSHDYIYGLRALYITTLGFIKVDYARDVGIVFAEAAFGILSHGGCDLLMMARHKGKRPSCPSWAPDWGSLEKLSWMDDPVDDLPDIANKDEIYSDTLSLSSDFKTLSIPGAIVARVARSSPGFMQAEPDCQDCAADGCVEHCWDRVARWLEACRSASNDVNHLRSLARIFCNRKSELGSYRSPLPYEQYAQVRALLPDLCKGEAREDANTKLEYADLVITAWLKQRHLVLTEDGAMGVALLASGVEAGDVIVRFKALEKHYFALRPVQRDGGQKFVFFGWIQLFGDVKPAPTVTSTHVFDII